MNPSHALRGVDNPGMERVDMVDLEDPTSGGVFATDTSLLTNGMNGRKFTHPALPVFVLLPWWSTSPWQRMDTGNILQPFYRFCDYACASMKK